MPTEIETISPNDLEINRARSHLSEAHSLMKDLFWNPSNKGSWKHGELLINIDPDKGIVKTRRESEARAIEEHFTYYENFFSYKTIVMVEGKRPKPVESKVFGDIEIRSDLIERGLGSLWCIVNHIMPKLLENQVQIPQPQPLTFH